MINAAQRFRSRVRRNAHCARVRDAVLRALATRHPESVALAAGGGALWFGFQQGLSRPYIGAGAVAAATGVLFVNALACYGRRVLAGESGERAVKRTLDALGVESIHDLCLPSGRGTIQIDHVALFANSLAVIETKTYSGRLRLHDDGPWFRIGRHGRLFAIPNPLRQLDAERRQVAALFPGLRVWGAVVLAGSAGVESGHFPAHVHSLQAFGSYVAGYRGRYREWRPTDEVAAAGRRLRELKVQYGGLAKRHVGNARRRRGERFSALPDYWEVVLWGAVAELAGLAFVLGWTDVI